MPTKCTITGEMRITKVFSDHYGEYIYKLEQDYVDEIFTEADAKPVFCAGTFIISETTPGPGYMGSDKAYRWSEHYKIPMPDSLEFA